MTPNVYLMKRTNCLFNSLFKKKKGKDRKRQKNYRKIKTQPIKLKGIAEAMPFIQPFFAD